LQSVLAGAALGRAAGSAFEGVFEVTHQNSWARRPFLVLAPGVAARVRALGIATPVNLADDAKRGGLGQARFDLLTELARSWPELASALELWRRGITDRGDFEQAMRRQGYPDDVIDQLAHLRTVLHPPSDVIRWAVREAFNPPLAERLGFTAEFPEAFADYAEQLGIPREDAERDWIAHWTLPSYSQLSEMLFRGEIGPELFGEALKALDYPAPWRERLEAIARRIPTMTDFQRLARREVYNEELRTQLGLDAEYPDAFTAKAALHGMSEADARDLWAGGWRYPSARQGYQMLWRGEIDQPMLRRLLRALDYPQFWRDKLLAIARPVPGRVDLRRLRVAGIRTRAETKAGYERIGFTDADAEDMTLLAEADKARADLAGESSYSAKARTQLWTTTHRSYVMGEATKTIALNNLSRVGVPVDERDPIIVLWDRERELRRRQLTPAQVKKAWVAAVTNRDTGAAWTRDDALAALIERGYSPNDANEFLDLPPSQG
jgi:hypothetical protein